MAVKQFYHDIDLLNVGQLVGARKQNVTTSERTALAATLGAGNTGLFVYDTTEKRDYTWDGAAFIAAAIEVVGDVIFKGIITTLTNPSNVVPVSGYEYVIGTAGTLAFTGVTFIPSAVVEIGDRVLFTSATEAYIQQRNDEQATSSALGNVRLASQAEVTAGTDALKALTPATLAGALVANKYVRSFTGTVNVPGMNAPVTVTHNLNLVDPAGFTFSTFFQGNEISLEVDAVDANSLTLKGFPALTGVKVTVQGASTVYAV